VVVEDRVVCEVAFYEYAVPGLSEGRALLEGRLV